MHHRVALGIDIRADMMGDLAGITAEADAAVVGDSAEPDRTAIDALFERQPEPDMVPSISAAPVRLFESQLFLFALVIERADRRIMIRPVQHHAAGDRDTGSECHRVSW